MNRSARRILTGHLAHIIDGEPLRNLTWLAKQLLASSRYRVSHAMVRSLDRLFVLFRESVIAINC